MKKTKTEPGVKLASLLLVIAGILLIGLIVVNL